MTYDPDLARGKRERSREPHPFWRGVGLVMMNYYPNNFLCNIRSVHPMDEKGEGV